LETAEEVLMKEGFSTKVYVITTGAVFGLIALAHVLRVIQEGPELAKSPGWVLITLLAGVLCVWAWTLVRRKHS
jgi:hypothetical protein